MLRLHDLSPTRRVPADFAAEAGENFQHNHAWASALNQRQASSRVSQSSPASPLSEIVSESNFFTGKQLSRKSVANATTKELARTMLKAPLHLGIAVARVLPTVFIPRGLTGWIYAKKDRQVGEAIPSLAKHLTDEVVKSLATGSLPFHNPARAIEHASNRTRYSQDGGLLVRDENQFNQLLNSSTIPRNEIAKLLSEIPRLTENRKVSLTVKSAFSDLSTTNYIKILSSKSRRGTKIYFSALDLIPDNKRQSAGNELVRILGVLP